MDEERPDFELEENLEDPSPSIDELLRFFARGETDLDGVNAASSALSLIDEAFEAPERFNEEPLLLDTLLCIDDDLC